MPYAKHNLYWGKYPTSGQLLHLEEADWIAMKYIGDEAGCGRFTNDASVNGEIYLILSDKQQQFWPVISHLTKDEARKLAREITAFIDGK